jgi:hypothetical protein
MDNMVDEVIKEPDYIEAEKCIMFDRPDEESCNI